MLEDREFFIRKAIGWVLRDTARKRPGLVFSRKAQGARAEREAGLVCCLSRAWLGVYPAQRGGCVQAEAWLV